MIATDEDALMADFIEHYHADWRAFPVKQSAALAFHLPQDSRIKRIMSGRKWDMDTMLLAAITDRLGTLIWMFSEDGAKGRNRPESVYAMLSGDTQKKEESDDLLKFASGADFMKHWKEVAQKRKERG